MRRPGFRSDRSGGVLLGLLRKHIRAGEKLFFSAFIDDELEGFEGRDKDLDRFIHHYVVCSPA